MVSKYYSHSVAFSTILVVTFVSRKFYCDEVQSIYLLLLGFLRSYVGNHGLIQGYRFIPMFTSKGFLLSVLTFNSMTYFESMSINSIS